MAYAGPIFSSGNPTVDQLFGRQFAVNQSETAQQMEGEKNAIARQQIMAQEKLAQAQLAGQQQEREQANLFKMNQSKQVDRQLDIDEKYKGALGAKTGARSLQDIDEANKMSEGIASQLNGSFQTKLTVAEAALDKKYADDVKALGSWNFGLPGNTAKSAEKLKFDYDAAKAILPDTVFNQLHDIGTKYYPAGTYGADPVGRKFLPVRITGGTPAQPGASPVPFNMGTPPLPGAGVGAPPPPVVPDPNAQVVVPPPVASAGPGNPAAWMMDRLGLGGGGAPAASVPSAAPVAAPPIRIPVPGGGSIEMSNAVASEVERQLRAVAPEQRAATAAAIRDSLIKSGQAKIIEPPATLFMKDKDYPVGYPVGF